jgi:hypothetical protein
MTTPARGLPWGKSTAGQKTKKRKEKRGQPIRKIYSVVMTSKFKPSFDLTVEDPLDVFPPEIVYKIFDDAIFNCAKTFLHVTLDGSSKNNLITTRGSWIIDTWLSIRRVSKKWNQFIMSAFTEDKLQRLWASNIVLLRKEISGNVEIEWLCEFFDDCFITEVVKITGKTIMTNNAKARLFLKHANKFFMKNAIEELKAVEKDMSVAESKKSKWCERKKKATSKKRKWKEEVEELQSRSTDLEQAISRSPYFSFVLEPVIQSTLQAKPNF